MERMVGRGFEWEKMLRNMTNIKTTMRTRGVRSTRSMLVTARAMPVATRSTTFTLERLPGTSQTTMLTAGSTVTTKDVTKPM
jgi:hypothetical protein